MTDFNMDEIIAGGIKAARETIETCRLVETRMINQYVLALGDGSVFHSTGAIHAFGVKLDKVERTRDIRAIAALRKHLIEMNPGNDAVARLSIMSWKEAARIQRAVAEDVIARFEELQKAP